MTAPWVCLVRKVEPVDAAIEGSLAICLKQIMLADLELLNETLVDDPGPSVIT